jgi:hypothetical protein
MGMSGQYRYSDPTLSPSFLPTSGYFFSSRRKLRFALCGGHLRSIKGQRTIPSHFRSLFSIKICRTSGRACIVLVILQVPRSGSFASVVGIY